MRKRQFRGRWAWVVKALTIGTIAYAVLYAFDLLLYFGVMLMPVSYAGLFLGLYLCLTFLLVAPSKKSPIDKVPWYDYLFGIISLAGGVYVFLFYRQRVLGSSLASPVEIALFIGMVVAILEAVRRTVGWPMVVILLIFLVYAPFGDYFPGMLRGPGYSLPQTAGYLYLFAGGIFGGVIQTISTMVVGYFLFAQLLYGTGAGKFFVDLAYSLLGRFSGGPAKGAVLASGLFGMLTGSPAANTATTGIVTIPLMKQGGYKSEYAAGVEAAAGTGGSIMPPVMGTVAFLVAQFLDISYGEVCIMAAWPAILYYAALLAQVHFQGVKNGLHGMPAERLPSTKRTLAQGWHFVVPLAVLVYFLMVQQAEPTTSALYAILALIAVSLLRKEGRAGPRTILKSLDESGKSLLNVIPICAGAGLLAGTVGLTGLGIRLSQILIMVSHGNVIILVILAAVASLLLGTGLPSVSCYILLALLVAPALVSMGLNEKAVHLFILYMGVASYLTPPTCVPPFIAAAIAEAKPFATAWHSMRLAIVAYIVPFMFIFNPALILIGSAAEIVLSAITSAIGIITLAGGIEGFLVGRLNWVGRGALLIGGVLTIVPDWRTDIVGGLLLSIVGLWQWVGARRVAVAGVETG